ncbi:MAG: M48 family metallopeptidase [Alphaproteobacteria bacterium]|nr:M48 family metallopeptidase [Alphaproteobacteria bacterium]
MVSDPSGNYLGYFNDGQTAANHEVDVAFGPSGLLFGLKGAAKDQHWTYEGLQPVRPVPKTGPARLRYEGAAEARLIIASPQFAQQVLQHAPQLGTSAGHKTTAKIAAMCLAGIIAFGLFGWLILSAAPSTVATLIPNAWWRYMGAQIEATMIKSAKQCNGAEGKKALARMAFRFADNVEADTVRVYDLPIINAFAMAGGRVVLTRGLIDGASTPDEVAGVLAHELGHVKARHPEAQIVRVFGLQLIMSALWGGNGMGDAMAQGGAMLAILRYTRGAESEADAIAIELMKKAKINPKGLADFFELVKKQPGVKVQESLGQIGNILSTHPGLDERIANIEKLTVGPTTPALSDKEWEALKAICK